MQERKTSALCKESHNIASSALMHCIKISDQLVWILWPRFGTVFLGTNE